MKKRALPQLVALFALGIAAASCGSDPTTPAEEMLGASDEAHDHVAEHDESDSAAEESVVVHEPDPVAVDGAEAPTIGLDVTADPAGGINVLSKQRTSLSSPAARVVPMSTAQDTSVFPSMVSRCFASTTMPSLSVV